VAQVEHATLEERIVLDREQAGLVRPVLEDAALAQECRDVRLVVGADARGKREPVRAVDGRDRVELHGLETPDLRRDVRGLRAAEAPRIALVGDDVAAQRREFVRHRLCARYSSRSERVTTPTGLPSRATSTAFER